MEVAAEGTGDAGDGARGQGVGAGGAGGRAEDVGEQSTTCGGSRNRTVKHVNCRPTCYKVGTYSNASPLPYSVSSTVSKCNASSATKLEDGAPNRQATRSSVRRCGGPPHVRTLEYPSGYVACFTAGGAASATVPKDDPARSGGP
jgi:hypothetical protein